MNRDYNYKAAFVGVIIYNESGKVEGGGRRQTPLYILNGSS